MFATIWNVLTLPFRLIGWTVELLGRFLGLGLGFALMVGGVALGAETLYWFGIPVFLIGLVMTLRALG